MASTKFLEGNREPWKRWGGNKVAKMREEEIYQMIVVNPREIS